MTPAAEENVYHNDQRKWSQTSFTPMDQFDEFFYKSTHYGQNFPPEVNIEVPSDSDSSRRPSKYTLSNASSTHDLSYANEERKNTVGNFLQNAESSRRVSQPQNALAGILKTPV